MSVVTLDVSRFSGPTERQFFERATPVPNDEVEKTMSAVFHGLIPGLVVPDLKLLRDALKLIHSVGFKARELAAQSSEVRELYRRLSNDEHCAVGLSSLGPLLYCISSEDYTGRINDAVGRADVLMLADLGADNTGAVISIDGRRT